MLQSLTRTVETPNDGDMKIVRMFSNGDKLLNHEVESFAVPTLTIRAQSTESAQQQYGRMQKLKQSLRRLRGGIADASAPCKVEFTLRARAEDDCFDFGRTLCAEEQDTSEARRTIISFLRSHLFEVWHSLAPERIESLHGRFYLFDPFVKDLKGASVNTTWHQDGDSLVRGDDYFAHYYLPEDEATGVGATDWAEVALPEEAEASKLVCGVSLLVGDSRSSTAAGVAVDGDEDDEEELVFDWSGLSDDTRKERITPSNFLTVPTTEHSLLVIHDAGCFHRVPLSALFRKPQRTIARIEFHGRDRSGAKVLITAERSATAGWQPLECASRLPHSLTSLCSDYAREEAESAAPSRDCTATGVDEDEGLRAYVAGALPFKSWLERRLKREFGELPVACTDLA